MNNTRSPARQTISPRSRRAMRNGSGILLLVILAAASMLSCIASCDYTSFLGKYTSWSRQQPSTRRLTTVSTPAAPPETVVSKIQLLATPSPGKKPASSMKSAPDSTRYFLRFSNVQVAEDRITVYYDDESVAGGKIFPPKKKSWISWQTLNFTTPFLPTYLTGPDRPNNMLGGMHRISIEYLPSSKFQPQCASWLENTAYLVQTSNFRKDLEVWREGMIAAYQTLRDIGELPLVRIDEAGSITEITQGALQTCPLEYDFLSATLVEQNKCTRYNVPANRKRCSRTKDAWCRPGVWSYRNIAPDASSAPTLVKWIDRAVPHKFDFILNAISTDVRTLQPLSCYKDLIISSTSTLEWTEPASDANLRNDAVQVLKDFLFTADAVHQEQTKQSSTSIAQRLWMGYKDLGLAWLRQGIGPEDSHAGGVLTVKDEESFSLNAIAMDDLNRLKADDARRRQARIRSTKLLRTTKSDQDQLLPATAAADSLNSATTQTQQRSLKSTTTATSAASDIPLDRPIVTYMTKHHDRVRAVLNEEDIVRYILSRYNVTLKVTTFQETLGQIITLMNETDVLIGMSGPEWVNALFIKKDAVCLEMLPFGFSPAQGSENIVTASLATYKRWVNKKKEHSFIRTADSAYLNLAHKVHPHHAPEHPSMTVNLDTWSNQHTYVDMEDFGRQIDSAMIEAGVARLV